MSDNGTFSALPTELLILTDQTGLEPVTSRLQIEVTTAYTGSTGYILRVMVRRRQSPTENNFSNYLDRLNNFRLLSETQCIGR